jgi:hypothetical protein
MSLTIYFLNFIFLPNYRIKVLFKKLKDETGRKQIEGTKILQNDFFIKKLLTW